MKRIFCISRYY